LSCKEVNSKKGDKTPQEAGLRLIRKPEAPKRLPAHLFIHNKHNIEEWEIFLKK
jgi:hypothetical protein